VRLDSRNELRTHRRLASQAHLQDILGESWGGSAGSTGSESALKSSNMNEGITRDIDETVASRRNHELGCNRAWRIDGGLMRGKWMR